MGLLLFSRVMPHLSNFSPYASLILLSGQAWKKPAGLILTGLSLVFSDIMLAFLFGYSVFGLWSLFTYSGFLMMALGSSYYLSQKTTLIRIAAYALSSTLGYWLWTNFGTWLTTDLYAHSFTGWINCLIAGLPFLQNSLLAALVFVPFCLGLAQFIPNRLIGVVLR